MRVNDAVSGALLAVLGLGALYQVQGYPSLPRQPYGPATFPTIIAVMLLCAAATLIVRGLRARGGPWIAWRGTMPLPQAALPMAYVPAGIAAYVWLTPVLGFPIVAPVLIFAPVAYLNRRPVVAVAVAAVASAIIWFAFSRMLMVPLPLGILESVVYG